MKVALGQAHHPCDEPLRRLGPVQLIRARRPCQAQVNVQIDKTGQESPPSQVQHLRIGGIERAPFADRGNASISQEDVGEAGCHGRVTVNDLSVGEDQRHHRSPGKSRQRALMDVSRRIEMLLRMAEPMLAGRLTWQRFGNDRLPRNRSIGPPHSESEASLHGRTAIATATPCPPSRPRRWPISTRSSEARGWYRIPDAHPIGSCCPPRSFWDGPDPNLSAFGSEAPIASASAKWHSGVAVGEPRQRLVAITGLGGEHRRHSSRPRVKPPTNRVLTVNGSPESSSGRSIASACSGRVP